MATNTDKTERNLFALVLAGACLMLLAGCNSGSRMQLTGEVTFEGQPLSQGTIVFTPVDATAGPSTGCDIVSGKYDVPGELGGSPGVVYKVQITSLAKSGKFIPNPFDPKGPPVEVDANFLPATYNTRSILTVKIVSGSNRIDFALKKDGTAPQELTPE
jgi:hypothetical protein